MVLLAIDLIPGGAVELSELFRSWEDDLVNEAVTELRHARLKHYIADGEEVTRERVTRFIEKAATPPATIFRKSRRRLTSSRRRCGNGSCPRSSLTSWPMPWGW
jgi:hypothetical protein